MVVAHDFDVSGFSIFGTLASDGRRYRFCNDVPIVDLGSRLSDVEALRLDSEPVEAQALRRSTPFAIAALNSTRCPLMCLSGSSNASSRGAWYQQGRPGNDVLEQHARRVLTRALTNKALEANRAKAEADAASVSLPSDLHHQVVAALKRQSDTPLGHCGRRNCPQGGQRE
jgi:hypothetical protein